MTYFYFSDNFYITQYKDLLISLAAKGSRFGILNGGEKLENNYSLSIIELAPKNKMKILFWEAVLNYARIKKQKNISFSFNERLNWRVKKYSVLKQELIQIFKTHKKGLFYYVKKFFRQNNFSIYVHCFSKFSWLHDVFFSFKIVDNYLFSELDKLNVNRIIFCYQGPHAETHLLLKYAKSRKIELIFYQHNWDNISSKEILNLHPDILLVWSYQCLLHATSIMRIPESKVIIAGSYRLDEHINSKRKFEINHLNNHAKYILLLGDSTDFDEYSALLIIAKILEDFGENWSCIYRPHPYLNKKKFSKSNLPKNILIDEQFDKEYFDSSSNSNEVFLRRLSSLKSNSFIQKVLMADFVIVGGSTITLECLVIGKPVILINAKLRTVNVLNKTHFFGIDKLTGVIKLDENKLNYPNLKDAMIRIQKLEVDKNKLQYFYDSNNPKFEQTIFELIND